MTSRRINRWIRSLRRKSRAQLQRYLYIGVFAFILGSFFWGLYRVVVYAHHAERLEISQITVSGLGRITENEILARIDHVPGTNVLSIDLEEARNSIEAIARVHHATVKRVWPDEIVIAIVEREPIGLARIDGEIFQVDAEGVVLPIDPFAGTDFPVLGGLYPGDIEGNRSKIDVYIEMVEAIGQAELSEIHVSDLGEVSVVPADSPMWIDLGTERHRDRWTKYVKLRSRIRAEYPGAVRLDLRFEDQVIIRTEPFEPGGEIIWGEERKSL